VTGASLASFSEATKCFGDHTALRGLSLEVRGGEVLGLLGPNGAGKTTALRLLCGLLTPDSGHLSIHGHDLASEPIEARRHLGYVPEGAPLYSNLTPFEHLTLVGRLHEMSSERIASESERLLSGLELLERARDPIGGFSRGMRQKVAIACALLPRPALLVLDEPLSGLDTTTALVIKAVLRAWAERGGAVLVTSHLLEVVERICDRMAILAEGSLLACGTFQELRGQAGGGSNLEEVFRSLTQLENPEEVAARILGR
jgi:ABC-2 type transport system ATP-binding protein